MPSYSTLSEMTHDPAGRGYHAVYREQEVNHCPGCGRTQWLIGRISAECAFCSTALLRGSFPDRNRGVAQVDAAGRANEEIVLSVGAGIQISAEAQAGRIHILE
jgi:hypothetical protein